MARDGALPRILQEEMGVWSGVEPYLEFPHRGAGDVVKGRMLPRMPQCC